jgi:hypothetical protein
MKDFKDKYADRLVELNAQKASITDVSGPLRKKYEDLWRKRETELAELHASIKSVEMPLPGIEAEAAALSQILSSRNVKMGV